MFESLVMPESETQAQVAQRRLRLSVPRDDGSLYAVPALENATRLADENHQLLTAATTDIQGRSLSVVRAGARKELCQAARSYTGTWADVPSCSDSTELVYVTGHQPLLFHPGVWVKNFTIGKLAQAPQAIGINLVVDNDTFASAALRIPSGNRDQPSFGSIAFDSGHFARPWEGAEIHDRQLFESFGDRVADNMSSWGIDPLIRELWPLVVERSQDSPQFSDCFTAGRNQLERRWGVNNLELPLSRLCQSESFLWFFSHIVAQLPCFGDVYNTALAEYRTINKVRSQTHPVPELRQQDDWMEAPFWIWRDGSHERRRVYAKQVAAEIHLQDGETVFAKLPLTPEGEACCAVEVLRELPQRGFHLRTRALTTTLFARLCLGDLFLHGIGGAKYDEMTDRIMARFYGIAPPSFMAVSATVLLPLHAHHVQQEDVTRANFMLRDLRHNPEKYLSESQVSEFTPLLEEKHKLLAEANHERDQPLMRKQRRAGRHARIERGRRLREITDTFAAAVAEQTKQIVQERSELEKQLVANQVLSSREFSFSLYSEEKLRPFMEGISV
ncbi:hypothetical protein Mal52_54520 [Symmachiella dynata]|uniref:Uncharacterized protein n=2 Tax=Symmachiella dynata TaxID=2527995 RepID=A0A517ZWS4_9PLAN|nr:hypothetical protein Mal52_54520 [Symmachiella dynata]